MRKASELQSRAQCSRPRGFRSFFVALFAFPLTLFSAPEPRDLVGTNFTPSAEIGRELLGTKAPEWNIQEWLHSKPLTLAGLRGEVVLVRWWTGPQCDYCAASAEALNGFSKKYARRGLVVVGMYHHKAETPLTREHVETQARKLGFEFPVGIDEEWRILRRWWLKKEKRGWTSVTFLLDRNGVIRHIHPGGAFFAGEPGYTALDAAIERELRK